MSKISTTQSRSKERKPLEFEGFEFTALSWATCKYSLQVESLSNSPSLYMFLRRIEDIAFLFFTLNQQLPSVNILKDRHLLNSYFVQFFQAFRLREVVVYKNGIQVFHIRKAN